MAAFTFNLQRKIEPSLVTCGKFDGSHPCLAIATSAGSILVHSPHRQPPANIIDSSHENLERRLEWNGEIAELQIGRQVSFNNSSTIKSLLLFYWNKYWLICVDHFIMHWTSS